MTTYERKYFSREVLCELGTRKCIELVVYRAKPKWGKVRIPDLYAIQHDLGFKYVSYNMTENKDELFDLMIRELELWDKHQVFLIPC